MSSLASVAIGSAAGGCLALVAAFAGLSGVVSFLARLLGNSGSRFLPSFAVWRSILVSMVYYGVVRLVVAALVIAVLVECTAGFGCSVVLAVFALLH